VGTLYISEHTAGSIAASQVVSEPCVTEQTVPISGVSGQSLPFNEATRIIRVHCDVACSIVIGKNPTATNVNKRFAVNQTECFAVLPVHMLAVISNP
jgi:hypothetical protein